MEQLQAKSLLVLTPMAFDMSCRVVKVESVSPCTELPMFFSFSRLANSFFIRNFDIDAMVGKSYTKAAGSELIQKRYWFWQKLEMVSRSSTAPSESTPASIRDVWLSTRWPMEASTTSQSWFWNSTIVNLEKSDFSSILPLRLSFETLEPDNEIPSKVPSKVVFIFDISCSGAIDSSSNTSSNIQVLIAAVFRGLMTIASDGSRWEAVRKFSRDLNATSGFRIPKPSLSTRFNTDKFADDIPSVLFHAPHWILVVQRPARFDTRAHASKALFAVQ